MAQKDAQTAVHPVRQAYNAEGSAAGAGLVGQFIDADLAAAGLPPEGLAAIGGGAAAATWDGAIEVAAWLAGAIEQGGFAEAARILYEQHRTRSPKTDGGHVWRAPALAAQRLARRVLDAAAEAEALAQGVEQ